MSAQINRQEPLLAYNILDREINEIIAEASRCYEPSQVPRRKRLEENRADWIRTSDLLNPIQAHYQAVLRPDLRAVNLRCRRQIGKRKMLLFQKQPLNAGAR